MQKTTSRRFFLKAGFLSSAVFVMQGCELFSITTPLETITLLQKDLFPKADELNITTSTYMTTVFNHTRIDEEDKEFIKNGVKWLNEESVKMYKNSYTKILPSQREAVLQVITKEKWGESFIYQIMTFIFEAMLGDPIYGGNNNEKGWKWLEFEGGLPRPKERYL